MDDKMLRINGGLHKRIKLVATMHEMTIKDWTETVLRNAVAAEGMTLVDPGVSYGTDRSGPSQSQIEAEYMKLYGCLPDEPTTEGENNA